MPLRGFFSRRSKTQPERPRTAGYSPLPSHWWNQTRDLPLFTFGTIRTMLLDGGVRLALGARAAPISSVEWAHKEGQQWVPGIQSRKPEVAAFIERQLNRVWLNHLPSILSAQVWGWSAGEITLRLTEHDLVEIDRLEPRQATDCRMLVSDGQPWGIRVDRVEGAGQVDLAFPRAWFHAHEPEAGEVYGRSALLGAYSPWADKWLNGGALDVRRLFMHKDAYGGQDLGYPEGFSYDENGQEIPNRDIARQIVEQMISGGVITRPSTRDDKGNELWPLNRAVVPSNPQHILQYPKDLDAEIRRGIGVPDDVIDSDGTGAWAGKRVPLSAFYTSLDGWVRSIVSDLSEQVFDRLVMLNFGKAEDYEICHKPLAEQAMEQQSNAGGEQGDAPGNDSTSGSSGDSWKPYSEQPPGQRMSLAVNAVGDGVLGAAELVEAARSVIRMGNVGDTKQENGRTYRLNQNHRWERVGELSQPAAKTTLRNAAGKTAKVKQAKTNEKKQAAPAINKSGQPIISEKAKRALKHAKRVDRVIQRYSEEYNEPRLAKSLNGVSFPNGEPIDVAISDSRGVVKAGIELKTMVSNKAKKLTVKRSARERKAEWERLNKSEVHTVVFDDHDVYNAKGPGQHDESKRRILYRRGYGAFRTATMHVVKNYKELKALIALPDSKLPAAARRPAERKRGKLA